MNTVFETYLKEAIGDDNARIALDALSGPASVSVRMNPGKVNAGVVNAGVTELNAGIVNADVIGANTDNSVTQDFKALMANFPSEVRHKISPVAWSPYGIFLPERPCFTLDPLLHAGCYYVQDSSAMFVGHVFREVLRSMLESGRIGGGRPVRVLDLCAAPGGKTTDILASLKMSGCQSYVLVSNEIMKQRAAVLADNAGIWGDPHVIVTSVDPKAFASLQGYFDIIVADVPCSGEGMFRKDAEALAQWSADNVALCQARQRRIVADVWPALAEGGAMIYSTCTFNRFENDDNAEWIASELGAEKFIFNADFQGVLKTGMGAGLVPGLVPGEGQYCAALTRTSENRGYAFAGGRRQDRKAVADLPKDIDLKVRNYFCGEVRSMLRSDMIVAVPEELMDEIRVLDVLRPILRGTAVGQLKGKDIVPDEDLALCMDLKRGVFPEAELTREQALAFLHKDTLTLINTERGIVLLTFGGHPLGFVKNLGNRCNNLHPQGRRIRMNID